MRSGSFGGLRTSVGSRNKTTTESFVENIPRDSLRLVSDLIFNVINARSLFIYCSAFVIKLTNSLPQTELRLGVTQARAATPLGEALYMQRSYKAQ